MSDTSVRIQYCAILLLHIIQCSGSNIHTSSFISTPPTIPKIYNPRRYSILSYKVIDDNTDTVEKVANSINEEEEDDDDTFHIESGSIDHPSFEDNTVVDMNDWLSATRTLGSLFLKTEDEGRKDVFGRMLVDRDEIADDIDEYGVLSTPPSSSILTENSFASYLMKLKQQEEDNRERAAEVHQEKEIKDNNIGGGIFNQKAKDPNQELDESVSKLSISSEDVMSDMKILPLDENEVWDSDNSIEELVDEKDLLGLSYPEHYKGRIGRDMRHLAVSIAASIDKPWQWKLFFDEGGGVLPLLLCISDGAKAVQEGRLDFLDGDVEGTNSLKEQHEASFAAACTACRALRDLSALSKDFAAVVTDDLLRVDTEWSTCVVEGDGYDCSSGGLISDLLILLKHANEAKAPRVGIKGRGASFSLSNRRQRRDARRRCGLYVVQLLLAMVVASDEAVTRLRSTAGLIEAVKECSSYAPAHRFKRKWIRKPISFVKRILPGGKKKTQPDMNSWLEPGLSGTIQQNANKLLAAIGHNEWIPKLPGQRGLRVLCLDGELIVYVRTSYLYTVHVF